MSILDSTGYYIGDPDYNLFASWLNSCTLDQIVEYGNAFTTHIIENPSPPPPVPPPSPSAPAQPVNVVDFNSFQDVSRDWTPSLFGENIISGSSSLDVDQGNDNDVFSSQLLGLTAHPSFYNGSNMMVETEEEISLDSSAVMSQTRHRQFEDSLDCPNATIDMGTTGEKSSDVKQTEPCMDSPLDHKFVMFKLRAHCRGNLDRKNRQERKERQLEGLKHRFSANSLPKPIGKPSGKRNHEGKTIKT